MSAAEVLSNNFHLNHLCVIAGSPCGKDFPPSHPAAILVHTAVRLSAIVSSLAPLGPRRPIYRVALPAGPGPAYSTNPDSH